MWAIVTKNKKSQMFGHRAWSRHSSGLPMKTTGLNYLGPNCYLHSNDSHFYISGLDFF